MDKALKDSLKHELYKILIYIVEVGDKELNTILDEQIMPEIEKHKW